MVSERGKTKPKVCDFILSYLDRFMPVSADGDGTKLGALGAGRTGGSLVLLFLFEGLDLLLAIL